MNPTKLQPIFLVLALSACMERSPEYSARQVPILAAAINCDTEKLKTLAEGLSQTDLAQTAPGDSQGRPALHWAIQEGCDAGVDILLAAGADPNQAAETDHSFGSTPLNWAAFGSRLEMVRSLLAYGADPRMRSGRSEITALFGAAGSGDPEIVRILLAEGLKASERDLSGLTPLHYGAEYPEIARILLESGADVNTGSQGGATPLMWLSSRGESDRVNVDESLRTLLAAGADLHARSSSGVTPLISAVLSDDPVVVRALLQAGAVVNDRDYSSQTPLAIVRQHRRNVREGFLKMLLRVLSSEYRDHEDTELAVLDEVEILLLEAGAQA